MVAFRKETMLRITKRSEYGIMSMKYIASFNGTHTCSARMIAEHFNLPHEILAKILQKLVKKGLIISHKGKHGGYRLTRDPDRLTVGDIIMALEDSINVVDCSTEKGLCCEQMGLCNIENPMKKIQRDLNNYFHSITLRDLEDE